jgi:hypothetical protein
MKKLMAYVSIGFLCGSLFSMDLVRQLTKNVERSTPKTTPAVIRNDRGSAQAGLIDNRSMMLKQMTILQKDGRQLQLNREGVAGNLTLLQGYAADAKATLDEATRNFNNLKDAAAKNITKKINTRWAQLLPDQKAAAYKNYSELLDAEKETLQAAVAYQNAYQPIRKEFEQNQQVLNDLDKQIRANKAQVDALTQKMPIKASAMPATRKNFDTLNKSYQELIDNKGSLERSKATQIQRLQNLNKQQEAATGARKIKLLDQINKNLKDQKALDEQIENLPDQKDAKLDLNEMESRLTPDERVIASEARYKAALNRVNGDLDALSGINRQLAGTMKEIRAGSNSAHSVAVQGTIEKLQNMRDVRERQLKTNLSSAVADFTNARVRFAQAKKNPDDLIDAPFNALKDRLQKEYKQHGVALPKTRVTVSAPAAMAAPRSAVVDNYSPAVIDRPYAPAVVKPVSVSAPAPAAVSAPLAPARVPKVELPAAAPAPVVAPALVKPRPARPPRSPAPAAPSSTSSSDGSLIKMQQSR